MRKVVPTLALVLALAPGCGEDEKGPDYFASQLRPVNDSAVEGTARFELDGDELTMRLAVRNLVPRQIHPVAIHGHPGEHRRAYCPDAARNKRQGQARYGRILVPLEPRPTTAETGSLRYQVKYRVNRELAEPLTNRVIVMSGGRLAGGPYRPGLPVACGRITKAESL